MRPDQGSRTAADAAAHHYAGQDETPAPDGRPTRVVDTRTDVERAAAARRQFVSTYRAQAAGGLHRAEARGRDLARSAGHDADTAFLGPVTLHAYLTHLGEPIPAVLAAKVAEAWDAATVSVAEKAADAAGL